MRNIIVITGAPCAGKSSIIAKLRDSGFNCLQNQSRDLMKEHIEPDGNLRPSQDPVAFEKTLLEMRVKQYLSAPDGISFSNRSLVDDVGYLRHLEIPVPKEFLNAIDKHRFNRTVFLAEPWKEIYTTDSERRETFEEALELTPFIRQTYADAGYEILALPRDTVSKRIDFIFDKISP